MCCLNLIPLLILIVLSLIIPFAGGLLASTGTQQHTLEITPGVSFGNSIPSHIKPLMDGS
ncbi:hypothetical protein ACS0TY_011198 [Phlomoides rotata]